MIRCNHLCGSMFGLQNMATSSALKWNKLEETTIPQFDIGHMNAYFISRLVDDGLPANDYKDLHSDAYPLFKAGHIQSISVATQGNEYVF